MRGGICTLLFIGLPEYFGRVWAGGGGVIVGEGAMSPTHLVDSPSILALFWAGGGGGYRRGRGNVTLHTRWTAQVSWPCLSWEHSGERGKGNVTLLTWPTP